MKWGRGETDVTDEQPRHRQKDHRGLGGRVQPVRPHPPHGGHFECMSFASPKTPGLWMIGMGLCIGPRVRREGGPNRPGGSPASLLPLVRPPHSCSKLSEVRERVSRQGSPADTAFYPVEPVIW